MVTRFETRKKKIQSLLCSIFLHIFLVILRLCCWWTFKPSLWCWLRLMSDLFGDHGCGRVAYFTAISKMILRKDLNCFQTCLLSVNLSFVFDFLLFKELCLDYYSYYYYAYFFVYVCVCEFFVLILWLITRTK